MWPSLRVISHMEKTLDRPGLRPVLNCLRTVHQRRQVNSFWFHWYRPRRGDIIVDVGAGEGTQTAFMARRVAPHGIVYAIEANPNTFARLTSRQQQGRIGNLRCSNLAIGDQHGTCHIEDSSHHEANSLRPCNGTDAAVEIEMQSLDQFCSVNKIDRIDFLKMNIEGAERLAIQGMTGILPRIRHLCIACHDFLNDPTGFKSTRGVIMAFLTEHGFDIRTRQNHPYPWVNDHVHARNPRYSG